MIVINIYAPRLDHAVASEQQICGCGQHAFKLSPAPNMTAEQEAILALLSMPNHARLGSLKVPLERVFQIVWSPCSCTLAVTFQQAETVGAVQVTWTLILISVETQVAREVELAGLMAEGSGGFSFSPCGSFIAALLNTESGRALCVLDVRKPDTCPCFHHLDLAAAELRLPNADLAEEVWNDQSSRFWQWLPASSSGNPSSATLARLAVWLPYESSESRFRGAVLFSFTYGRYEPHRMHVEWGVAVHRPVWGLGGLVALDANNKPQLLPDHLLALCPDPSARGTPAHRLDAELTWQLIELEDVREGYQWKWDRVSPGIAYAWSKDTCFLALACCNGLREKGNQLMLQLVDGRVGAVRAQLVLLELPDLGFLIRRLRLEWSPDGNGICVTIALAQQLRDPNEHSVRKFLMVV